MTVVKQVKKTGGSSGGQVNSIVGGVDIGIDSTDPANPIANFKFSDIVYATLLAAVQGGTATNGIYNLTTRPNSGSKPLIVSVYNNTVTGLWVRAQKGISTFYLWQIEGYDFLNDGLGVYATDTQRNTFVVNLATPALYNEFPADDSGNTNNNLFGRIGDFTGFTGSINETTTKGSGIITATSSNAVISQCEIENGEMDVTAVVGGSTVENVTFIGTSAGETLTVPVGGLSNVYINLVEGVSTKAVTILPTLFAISFSSVSSRNWAGIVSCGGTQVKNITGLDKAPSYFKLKNTTIDSADTGAHIIFDSFFLDTLNLVSGGAVVTVTGSGWIDCYTDGTDVFILGYHDM